MSTKQIAEALNSSEGATRKLLAGMVEKGLIVRIENELFRAADLF